MNTELSLFGQDYLISWDVSDKDCPCIAVSVLRRSEHGSRVEADLLGVSHEKTGVISLRQALEQHEALKREEAEQ